METTNFVDLETIQAAASALEGQVVRTPLIPALGLNSKRGLDLHLKLENMQATGSFKDRGAFIKLSSLSPEERERGVIAQSAGNHAQGVAYHAQRLDIPATIVMPVSAPYTKVERTRRLGAQVVQEGRNFEEAFAIAQGLMKEHGYQFVHPFDDAHIVAGQGSIGLELLEDAPDLEAVIVPIGGGGLISGIAAAIKALKPSIKVYGVEVAGFCAIRKGERAGEAQPITLADGIAVKEPGGLTLAMIEALVDDIIVVTEPYIETAMMELADEANLVVEGAGAASYAAMLTRPDLFESKKTAAIMCGGNVDAQRLSSVLDRGLLRQGRLVMMRVRIDDSPGELAKATQIFGHHNANIVELEFQRLKLSQTARHAMLRIKAELPRPDVLGHLMEALSDAGYVAELSGQVPLA